MRGVLLLALFVVTAVVMSGAFIFMSQHDEGFIVQIAAGVVLSGVLIAVFYVITEIRGTAARRKKHTRS